MWKKGRRGRARMVVGLNYLCTQCPSPIELWVRIPLRRGVLDKTLCDKVCQWLAISRWFSPGTLISSTNKTDGHDLTETLLKVALNTINHIQCISFILCIYIYICVCVCMHACWYICVCVCVFILACFALYSTRKRWKFWA